MKRRFKIKTSKRKYFRILISILFLGVAFQVIFNFSKKIQLTATNEEFLEGLMYNSNHYLKYERDNSVFTNILNQILNIDFSNPLSLLNKTLVHKGTLEEETIFMVKINEAYLEDPNENKVDSPRIYIYNSHQSEEYSKDNYEKYGINPGVMMATYLLKEKLNSMNIPTIAEEGNITEFMRINNYTHAYSYVASRYFIESVIKENDFDLIIDLHRDSNKKESSTVSINGKNYAKVLFVVGIENTNYQKNLEITEKINNLILKKYPSLTRGIYKKEGQGVDGVYNQDLNSNMILLELGGYQNTISEVNNTITIMAEIIQEYLENV